MAKNMLKDLVQEVLRAQIGTRVFNNPAIAIGGTKPKVKTANAISYCINNVLYSKGATDDLFVHTDLTVQADLTTRYYLLCLDTSGNATIIQGTSTALPDVPASKCPVGYLKIVCNGAAFTPATTDHDAANITTTYVNLSQLPLTLA